MRDQRPIPGEDIDHQDIGSLPRATAMRSGARTGPAGPGMWVRTVRRLRVRCQTCEEVVVAADKIVLTSPDPSSSRYAFRCPLCLSVVEWNCTEVIARLLLLNGARSQPRPAPELLPDEERPVLDLSSIGELRRLLDRPDCVNLVEDDDRPPFPSG